MAIPKYILTVVMGIFLLSFFTCKEEGVAPKIPNISLNVEDVGVTDSWLKVKSDIVNHEIKNNNLLSCQLRRDGQQVKSFAVNSSQTDTLLLDENLLPRHTYNYKAFYLYNNTPIDSTDAVQLTTMDTTSHNFTWEIDTLGDGNSSVLYDVTILSDTLAYAVGEIYKKDSLGNWEEPYGSAIWNGKSWRLQRLLAWAPSGYVSILRPRGIFAFSDSDIWLAGGGVYHWDGKSDYVTPYWINSFPGNPNPILSPGQSAEKLWGTSSSNIYIVGNQGAVAFFNGSRWVKLNSETTVSINDIWGSVDQTTGNRLILCTASNIYDPGERKILTITEQNTVDTIPWVYRRRINSIWFKNEKRLFTAGDGVFLRKLDKTWKEFVGLGPYFTDHVRGIATNDIFVVGDFGQVWHWNGVSWHQYTEVSAADVFYSLSYKNNKMFAVGSLGSRAILLHMQCK